MNAQPSTPNIVVDENFIMLEKKLRRRYAERTVIYSDADTIEQERKSARAYSIAPSVFGESRVIGGISNYQNGETMGKKHMTADDFVAYFGICHDPFGAMNMENVKAPKKAETEEPRVYVNNKKIEEIKKINAKVAAKANKKRSVAAKKPLESNNGSAVIKEKALDSFFARLSGVRARALAGVAGVAVCFSLVIGSVFAFSGADEPTMQKYENLRSAEVASSTDDEVEHSLLSTLE